MDLIVAKHQFSNMVASSYAAAAVAAKVLIWVAMGASFYLVPETTRLMTQRRNTQPVLMRSLAIIAVCAVPCMLIFAFAAHPLLEAVFGEDKAIASNALLPLGAAFTVLSCTYLAVQYMLALQRVWFLVPLGLVAALEPVLLLPGAEHPAAFATVVLFVQLLAAAVAYVERCRAGRRSNGSQLRRARAAPDRPRSPPPRSALAPERQHGLIWRPQLQDLRIRRKSSRSISSVEGV